MEEHGSFAEKDPTVLEYLKGLFQGQTTVQEITTIQAEKTPPKLGDKSGLISIACFFLGQFLIEYLREGTGFFAGIFFVLGLIFAFLAFKKEKMRAYGFGLLTLIQRVLRNLILNFTGFWQALLQPSCPL